MFYRRNKQQQQPASPSPEPEEEKIDIELLEHQFDAIKVCLLEIRAFRRKKIIKTPTIHFMKKVDIEEAWPTCEQNVRKAYEILCILAKGFSVDYEAMPEDNTFGTALDQFANLIDRITLFMDSTDLSDMPLSCFKLADQYLSDIHNIVNQTNRHILKDFEFS